jgi:hypothetical protein
LAECNVRCRIHDFVFIYLILLGWIEFIMWRTLDIKYQIVSYLLFYIEISLILGNCDIGKSVYTYHWISISYPSSTIMVPLIKI